jgi:hypothetical protein
MDGANLAKQLAQGDIWKIIHDRKNSWLLASKEFQDRRTRGTNPKAIATIATHRPIEVYQLTLPARGINNARRKT